MITHEQGQVYINWICSLSEYSDFFSIGFSDTATHEQTKKFLLGIGWGHFDCPQRYRIYCGSPKHRLVFTLTQKWITIVYLNKTKHFDVDVKKVHQHFKNYNHGR